MFWFRVFSFCVFLCAPCLQASAQNIPQSALPGHEREIFAPPQTPLSRPASPYLQLPDTMAPSQAGQIRLHIKRIEVIGSTAYQQAQLATLYADLIGHEVTAAEIYALASRIGAKYGADGYLVARVVVVPQAVDPRAAVIKLQVIEGYIEHVEWPEEARRYRDLSSACFDRALAERPARTATIERCLLLASDLPGLKFSSTLRAGTHKDGGTVLVVALTEKPFDADIGMDNRGALGRGPWEYTGSVTENNRLGWDEAINFTYAGTIPAKELQFFSGNWHQVLTPDGLALNVNGSYSFGRPGIASLQTLDFKSNADTVEAGLSYPVIRSREQNLFLSGFAFVDDAESYALGSPFSDDRLRGLRLRANFDQVDSVFGTIGQSQAIGTFSQGFVGAGSTANGNPLASIANGKVDFSKFELSLNRTQALPNNFSLLGSLYGQMSASPLLAPEQCTFGGRYFGRAFYAVQFVGDRCVEELGELRYDIAFPANPFSQSQLYGFVDHGDLFRVDPSASTRGHLAESSAGAGLRLGYASYITADFQAARSFASSIDTGWRGYVVLSAHY
jgi:hemolysin activation/secretion protein